jgi:hypothetical protein
MKYLYVSITFFLSVSCAIHTGNTTGNAELQGSDFEIIDIGYGEAHTFKIFGIGVSLLIRWFMMRKKIYTEGILLKKDRPMPMFLLISGDYL